MSKSVLVTGATGLVGFELFDLLCDQPGVEVAGVSRRGSPSEPGIVRWRIGAEPCPPGLLDRHWDALVHTAADVRWTMPPEEAYRANVATVGALRPLVSPRTHVIHVSTAYAGGLRGDGASEDLADYRNTYEWSKAAAERLVRETCARVTIVRPPLIIGRRSDGRAARFAGMYTILRGIAVGSVPVLAADAEASMDVIPVDELASLLAECAREPGNGPGDPLVIAGGKRAPRVEAVVGAMLAGLNEWRAGKGREPLETPRIISPESWNRFFLPFAREHLTDRQNRMLDVLRNFEPYFALSMALEPTHEVEGVEDCVRLSARYWAQRNERVAALNPKPWRGVEGTD